MRHSKLLILGIASTLDTVTAQGTYECSLTETLFDAVARCPRLPPHANECDFVDIGASTTGRCPGTMFEWWKITDAAHPKRTPEPTEKAALYTDHGAAKRIDTMTYGPFTSADDHCEYSCKDPAFEDCEKDCTYAGIDFWSIIGKRTPAPTLQASPHTDHGMVKRSFTTTYGGCTAVCRDNLFNDCHVSCAHDPTGQAALPKRSPQPTLQAAQHKDPVTMTWAQGGSNITVGCKQNADEFGDCTLIHADRPTVTPKPALGTASMEHGVAKRSYTTTTDGCTITCNDAAFEDCPDMECSFGRKVKAALIKPRPVTMTWYANGQTDTVVCNGDSDKFSDCSLFPSATPKPQYRPIVQKRDIVTVTNDGCTAICQDAKPAASCDVHCIGGFTAQVALPTAQPLGPMLPVTIGVTQSLEGGVCTDIRSNLNTGFGDDLDCTFTEGPKASKGIELMGSEKTLSMTTGGCTIQCSTLAEVVTGFGVHMHCTYGADPHGFLAHSDIQPIARLSALLALPTPKPSPKLALQQRGLTTTHDGCTAVCWNQSPGIGCDIQCRDASLTKMPKPTSGVSSLWTSTFTSFDCTFACQDLYPGNECAVQCPGTLPTQAFAPVKAALAAPTSKVHRDLQARQAREARIARKFGLDARDVGQLEAVSEAGSALSMASAAIAEVASTTISGVVLPSAASSAISEAASYLSSVSQAAQSTSEAVSSLSLVSSEAISSLSSLSQAAKPTSVSATLTSTDPVTVSVSQYVSVASPKTTPKDWWSQMMSHTSTSTSASVVKESTTVQSTATSTTQIVSASILSPNGAASYEGRSLVGMLLLITIGVVGSVAFLI